MSKTSASYCFVFPTYLLFSAATPVFATSCPVDVGISLLPTIQCAKIGGGLDDTDNGEFDVNLVGVQDEGFFSARISDTSLPNPPPGLEVPLDAFTILSIDDGPTSSFSVQQLGQVSLMPTPAQFQDAFFETASKVTFTAHPLDPGTDPGSFDIEISISHDATLIDGPGNETFGDPFAGANFSLTMNGKKNPPIPIIKSGGFAVQNGDDTKFGGAYKEIASSTPLGAGKASFSVDETKVFPGTLKAEYKLKSDTVGSVFHDVFNTVDINDPSTWSVLNANTFTITVTSSNPNVRFAINAIPEPHTLALISAWTAMCVAGYWWRRQPRTTVD